MKTVRLGIVGLGNMGRAHAQNLIEGKVPGCELAAVCDVKPEAAAGFEKQAKFTDCGQMIRSGKIDAILIVTPHYSHTTIGIDALKNGLHVLVEKPISVHKADCERLIAAHKNKKQVFAAMFNQRTDPRYLKVRDLIRNGELGPIRRVNWIITDWFRTEAYYASGGWRATWGGEGGGVLLNQCPHQLDLYQWLFGLPKKVRGFCQIGRYHNIEVEDDVTAYFEYPDGMTAVFITSTGEAPGTNRLEITAERGRVVVEGGRIQFTRNETGMSEFSRTTDKGFARPDTWEITIPVSGYGEQHLGILKNFTEAILHKKPLIAPAAEGIRSVELANAILYSHFTGKTVDLPLSGAAYERLLKKKIASSKFVKKTVEKAAEDFTKSFNT
jgi:predicted dehydrogenase